MRNELLLATGICLLSAGLAEARAASCGQLNTGGTYWQTDQYGYPCVDTINSGGGGGSSNVTITGVGTATLSGGYLPVEDVLLDALISGGALQVSAASLPLPTGAATSAAQTTGNTTLSSILTALGSPVQANTTLTTTPAATSPAACTATVIATGGTATTLQSGAVNGISIQNGDTASDQNIATAEPVYINLVTTATASGRGSNVKLEPGQSFSWGPLVGGVTVSAIAATTSHAVSCSKW